MDNIKKQDSQENEPKPLPTSIKWEAPEYEFIPKSNNWFWSVGILSLAISVASILFGNILFAILILVEGVAVILYGAKKPKKIVFILNPRGLQIENRLFPFENLGSFWIHYDPPHKKFIAIEPKKFLMTTISAPLADIDPNLIRNYLLKFLREERREESLIATVSRLAGF